MNKIQADQCVLEMQEIKKQNLEELFLIIKYSFENLINSIFCKKSKTEIPKKCYNFVKEFNKIIKEERKILDFLINHISYIEENNLKDFIEKLDELNEQTINYFYQNLDSVEDAIEFDDVLNPAKREFKTLPENIEIKKEACNIVLSRDFLKAYLGYEDAFWKFIDARSVFSDEITEYQMEWEYNLGSQIKMNLVLPEIKDLNTALNCVKAYNKAHILYFYNNKTRLNHPEEEIKKYYKRMINYLDVE